MQNVMLGVILGMALQAGISAILADAGLIELTPTQQAHVSLLFICGSVVTAAAITAKGHS